MSEQDVKDALAEADDYLRRDEAMHAGLAEVDAEYAEVWYALRDLWGIDYLAYCKTLRAISDRSRESAFLGRLLDLVGAATRPLTSDELGAAAESLAELRAEARSGGPAGVTELVAVMREVPGAWLSPFVPRLLTLLENAAASTTADEFDTATAFLAELKYQAQWRERPF